VPCSHTLLLLLLHHHHHHHHHTHSPSSSTILLSSKPDLVLKLVNGDTGRAALHLSYMSSFGALLEFLLTPIFGKISDAHGRKLLLPAASAVSTLTRTAVFLNPTLPTMYFDGLVSAVSR
jgi:MFS family permease